MAHHREYTRQAARCPDCGGELVKSGWQRTNRTGYKRQVYLCSQCYRRTVNPRRGK